MGAGKSSLYRRLVNCTVSGHKLQSANEVKRGILSREARAKSVWHYLAFNFLLKNRALNHSLLVDKITHTAWLALEDKNEEFRPVIELVLHGRPVDGLERPDRALVEMSRFIRDLSDIALIQLGGADGLVLHDESLLQRGLGIALHTGAPQSFIEKYVALATPPDLVIYVAAPFASLGQRIGKRDGPASHHMPMIERSIFIASTALAAIQARSIPVIIVDGAIPVSRLVPDVLRSFEQWAL